MECTYYSHIRELGNLSVKSFNAEDFIPLKGTVLIQQPPPITATEGGIVLPEQAKERQIWGTVISVPEDEDCPVEPGDIVFFRFGAANEIHFSNKESLALLQYSYGGLESDILGKISKNVASQLFDNTEVTD